MSSDLCYTECGDGGCRCVKNATSIVDQLYVISTNDDILSCICGDFQVMLSTDETVNIFMCLFMYLFIIIYSLSWWPVECQLNALYFIISFIFICALGRMVTGHRQIMVTHKIGILGIKVQLVQQGVRVLSRVFVQRRYGMWLSGH